MTRDTIRRAIRADGTPAEQELAHELLDVLIAKVKPAGTERMPVSPVELRLIFRALHCLQESLECADEVSPRWFEEVRGAR
jgi:hypothetical protein